ncbi:UNVERIFIED_ORG: hypothetical protein ABIB52_002538 [Arthrobacter sp. UYCu721]
MISTIEAGRAFSIEASNPRLIEEELNMAVDAAIQHAMEEGRYGILVTRHGNTAFTVAVSAKVPYGQTLEENAPAEVLVRDFHRTGSEGVCLNRERVL